ncbi:ankyrin repeat domain-containing protein [Rhodopirellula bahusiensis]|uniref:ankyrin repeat domain-containing protein n=1 Tax=Rhodopirellula bahusiensis TaxID=2014065 RepID=UPI00326684E4
MNRYFPALLVVLFACGFVAAPSAFASELMDAIHEQDSAQVRTLIAAGANVNDVDGDGYFPLYYSIVYESPELTRMLLNAGAKVDQKEPEYGMPMIAHASAIGNLEVVQVLLQFKANPKAKDKFGGTASKESRPGWIPQIGVGGSPAFCRLPSS